MTVSLSPSASFLQNVRKIQYLDYTWQNSGVLPYSHAVKILSLSPSSQPLYSGLNKSLNSQSFSYLKNAFIMATPLIRPDFCGLLLTRLRGEKLNYKSVAKEISKPPFLAPEVQWASKFTVFVRFTFPLNVSNHTHIWYVT